MIDIWSSSGLRLPRQMQFSDTVPLPAEETYFVQSNATSILPPPARSTGIWAEMARLARIWADIQEMNRASVEGDMAPSRLEIAVEDLAARLNVWRASLPSFLADNRQNRRHYISNGLGASFTALHLGYHYYSEILFYQFLAKAGSRDGLSKARTYAQRCAQHAMAFCDVLYDCDAATDGQECLFIMLGHMLVVTSSVYVHMLLFADSSAAVPADTLRERLEHNFTILTRLQLFWKTLESSLCRLKTFHNACLQSIEGSWDMDRWMLRFILEFGMSMPEKFIDGGETVGREAFELPGQKKATDLESWVSETFGHELP